MKRSVIRLAKHIFFIPPFESALRKLTAGKEYGTLISRLAPTQDQYEKGTIRNTTVNGINFRLDLSDLVAWFVYWGFSERSRNSLYALAKESDVVFDIGANMGDVTLNMAKIVGETGKVFAFEPYHETFEKLRRNYELNTFDNIELIESALAEKKGMVQMVRMDEHNSGMNRVASGNSDSSSAFIKTTSLDEFVETNRIEKISLIKIDVEGFEMNVLRGARRTLQQLRPSLFIEIDDNNLRGQGASSVELLDFLKTFGYSFQHAESGSVIDTTADLSNMHFDIIALPEL